jgi:dUTP pyrophosphatase
MSANTSGIFDPAEHGAPDALRVAITQLDPGLTIPAYARFGDAGLDLVARVAVTLLPSGGRSVVPTGISIAVPLGWGAFVLPRSGLAAKHGVTVVNAPGLIDAGYRGEVMVPMVNTDPHASFAIERGERIAQLVFLRVPTISWNVVEELPPSPGGDASRGAGGFGHSGR